MEARNLLKITTIALASCLAYYNIISAPLLYDDTAAILKNPDVQEITDISKVWGNDFWGFFMQNKGSHKSYRPITVLLFRCLHHFFGNWSPAYHVTNIILHSTVSVLFFIVCRDVVFVSMKHEEAPMVAGLAFALHPIHTEAVCCAVGCAELLSAICFMSSLLIYFRSCESSPSPTVDLQPKKSNSEKPIEAFQTKKNITSVRHRNQKKTSLSKRTSNKQLGEVYQINLGNSAWLLPTIISLLLATIGMLSKETGMTVIGILFVYEIIHERFSQTTSKIDFLSYFNFRFLSKTIVLLLWGLSLLVFRLWIMGWGKPTYSKDENPASYAKEKLTRTLTYVYLCWKNFFLLLFPLHLSYDYSVGTIPLITTMWDARNLNSVLIFTFCGFCGLLSLKSLSKKADWSRALVLGFSILIFSFLPASNLFFPVGFVIAERVLYLPSAGFIILLVLLWSKVSFWIPSYRRHLQIVAGVVLFSYLIRTFSRNQVWQSKENLFRSGMDVYPNTPKIVYNWANNLQNQNRWPEAMELYERVLELQPTYFGALNNMGSAYEVLGRSLKKAESYYFKASKVNPNNEIGFANLLRLQISQNRFHDAVNVLKRSIREIPESSDITLIISQTHLLFRKQPTAEIGNLYFALLKRSCIHATSHPTAAKKCSSNFVEALRLQADLFQKKGSLSYYNSLNILINRLTSYDQGALQALLHALPTTKDIEEMTLVLIGKTAMTDENDDLLTDLAKWEKAILLFKASRFLESKAMFESYIKANPNNLEASGQYAALLFQMGNYDEAERKLVSLIENDNKCKNSGVWHNLATLYGRKNNFEKAINLLQTCIKLRKEFFGTNNDPKRSTLLHQLGMHMWRRSQQFTKSGLISEAKTFKNNSIKHIRSAIKLDPSNIQAQETLQQIYRS